VNCCTSPPESANSCDGSSVESLETDEEGNTRHISQSEKVNGKVASAL